MLKKQLRLFITIIILLVLIFISYRCSDEDEIPTIYEHDEKFSEHILVDGIDVSAYQGKNINWDEVKESGVDFVMIRAAYRGANNGEIKTDETFEQNIKDANEAGIMTGAYFFSQAIDEAEAKEEANYLLSLVSDYEITMPLVIDLEEYENSRQSDLSSTETTDIALAFCDTIENAGYQSMVYGNRNYLTVNQDTHRLEISTEVWLAHYTDKTNYGGDYIMWQCSSQSQVEGIEGNVDKNFWYLDKENTLTSCTVELKDDKFLDWGRNVEPKVIVKDGENKLKEGEDYSVSYIKNSSPGTGYVIVQGMNSYFGKTILEFKISSFF